MSNCNGFKLVALNPDCDRIAVKSSIQTTWNPSYSWRLWKGKKYEIGFEKDELMVISFQSVSGGAAIEIHPLGDKVGTLIAQSSKGDKTRNGKRVGGGTQVLRVGSSYRFELEPGESIVLRGSKIVHPVSPYGAGLAV